MQDPARPRRISIPRKPSFFTLFWILATIAELHSHALRWTVGRGMGRRTITIAFCLTFVTIPVLCVHSKQVRAGETSQVTLLRTPHEGIQPQTVLDRDGVLHMIYFNGDASGGDIEYVSRKPNGKDFWEPIRVNSQPGSAIAIGTVRGPQLAVGRNGRVYVIWFGSQDRKSTRLNSSHTVISYAVFCLKKKKEKQ